MATKKRDYMVTMETADNQEEDRIFVTNRYGTVQLMRGGYMFRREKTGETSIYWR